MPIFEYQCGKCGKVSEILQLAGDDSKPVCASCGSSDLSKVFSRMAVRSGKLGDGCNTASSCGMGGSCAMQGGPSAPCCGGHCNH
ncbi:MAG TPA: zinc ribbon domain-containing protein [bacterium]|nr:zinc ribbon domain-containing protein [bacterium]